MLTLAMESNEEVAPAVELRELREYKWRHRSEDIEIYRNTNARITWSKQHGLRGTSKHRQYLGNAQGTLCEQPGKSARVRILAAS